MAQLSLFCKTNAWYQPDRYQHEKASTTGWGFFLDLANLLAYNQFQQGLIDANRNIYVCYAWSLKGFTMLKLYKK